MEIKYGRRVPLRHLRALMLLLPLLLIPAYAAPMRAATVRGIRLCATTVIPSVFPFMILSSMILHYRVADSLPFLSRPFERIFRVGKGGLGAFLCGSLCGFPLGAKCALEAYRQKRIGKDECERLIAFSSNASPAFLIVGVGTLRTSLGEGLLLYLVMMLCSILLGFLLGIKKSPSGDIPEGEIGDFSFTSTVENAGMQTLFVCSYILLFSAILGALSPVFANNSLLYMLFLSCAEIGTACSALATAAISKRVSFALTAFAVSFGGICVHLQAAGILRESDISMRRYFFAKILQGALAFLLCFFLF